MPIVLQRQSAGIDTAGAYRNARLRRYNTNTASCESRKVNAAGSKRLETGCSYTSRNLNLGVSIEEHIAAIKQRPGCRNRAIHENSGAVLGRRSSSAECTAEQSPIDDLHTRAA